MESLAEVSLDERMEFINEEDFILDEKMEIEEDKERDRRAKISIKPDVDWMTKNTADLTEMLDSIPKESLEIIEIVKEESENMFDFQDTDSKQADIKKSTLEELKCDECDFKSESKRSIRMHKAKLHEPSILSCTECNIKLKSKDALKYHRERKHKKFICEICDVTANTARNLKMHKEKEHTKSTSKKLLKPDFSCKQCNYEGNSSTLLKAHTSSKHAVAKCNFCDFKSSTPKDVRIHNLKKHIQDNTPLVGTKRRVSKSNQKGLNSSPPVKIVKSKDIPVTKKGLKKPLHLKELPIQLKNLPQFKDSFIYKVPGDGACCPTSTSLHLWLDKRRGTELARDLNTHIGMHREYYEPKLLFPIIVEIGIGGKTETFEDTDGDKERFFDWLVTSKEGAYMWREGVDVLAISNLCNMEVDVVKVDTNKNSNLVVPFKPDLNFPWVDDEKPTSPKPKMTLLNTNDIHFDLIVNKDSPLWQDGDLELQEKKAKELLKEKNVQCELCDFSVETSLLLTKHKTEKHPAEMIEHLLKENQKLNDKIRQMTMVNNQKEFAFSEKCDLCEEEFTLKLNLNEHKKECHKPASQTKFVDAKRTAKRPSPVNSNQDIQKKFRFSSVHNCDICGEIFNTSSLLQNHTQSCHMESEADLLRDIKQYNCDDCDFQANTGPELKKHLNLTKHRPNSQLKETDLGNLYKCRNCSKEYSSKPDLMDHRRDEHKDIRKKCWHKINRKCSFEDDVCWYSHKISTSEKQDHVNDDNFDCQTCDDRFETISGLMKHRKVEHTDTVPICKAVKDGLVCDYKENCWFSHLNQPKLVQNVWEKRKEQRDTENSQDQSASNSGFWQRQASQEPPDQMLAMMRKEIQNLMKQEIQDLMKQAIQTLTIEVKNLLNSKEN